MAIKAMAIRATAIRAMAISGGFGRNVLQTHGLLLPGFGKVKAVLGRVEACVLRAGRLPQPRGIKNNAHRDPTPARAL